MATATEGRNGRASWAVIDPAGERISEHATRSAAESAIARHPERRGRLASMAPAEPVSVDARPDQASGGVRPIATELIDPSPFQMRKHFDEAELRKLADSLKTDGQLQNAVVRRVGGSEGAASEGGASGGGASGGGASGGGDRYELIAGERRWRAAKLAGLPLRCAVIEADDKRAVELAGMENFARAELNAVEEAGWFEAMIETAGYTQAALARRLGISQPKVAQRLGLLELPEAWRERVITGVMPASWARELVPWVGRERVMTLLAGAVENEGIGVDVMTLPDFRRGIMAAVRRCSRPLSGTYCQHDETGRIRHGTVAFRATRKQREELDVETLTLGGRKEPRAFNVDRWEELQAAGVERRKKRAAKEAKAATRPTLSEGPPADQVDAMTGDARAAKTKANHQREDDALDRLLARYRDAYLRAQVAERVTDAPEPLLVKLALCGWAFGDPLEEAQVVAAINAAGGERDLTIARPFGYTRNGAAAVLSLDPGGAIEVLRAVISATIVDPVVYQDGVVDAIAEALGLTLDGWRLAEADLDADASAGGRTFLGMYCARQLRSLAREWKVRVVGITKLNREQLIDALVEQAGDKPAPQALRKAGRR